MPNPVTFWMFDPDWGTFWQIAGAIGAVIVSVIALAAAVGIAIRQFLIMDQQGKVIDKQTSLLEEHKALLGRIETIEDDQRAVLKRQGEILETQHEIMQEQRSRRAELRIHLKPGAPESRVLNAWEWFDIYVHNVGTRKAEDVFWSLAIPKSLKDRVKGEAVQSELWKGNIKVGGQECMHFSGRHEEPVLRRRDAPIVSIALRKGGETEAVVVWASVECEDSRTPENDDEWIGLQFVLQPIFPEDSPVASS